MKKIVKYAKNNLCYGSAQKITPNAIMIHSTACPGVMAKRFLDAFNVAMPNGCEVCCHGFLDDKEYYQILPYTYNGWHAGGSANKTHIGIEVCEPYKYSNKTYFNTVKRNVISLCADLCEEYNIPYKNITTHCVGYQKGIASNHADIYHWWKKYHNYTMEKLQADVKAELEERRMATLYKKGDECIGVLAVKEMLIHLHDHKVIKQKVDENGIYGSGTVLAVKEVQKLSNLTQTGNVGQATIKALKRLVDKTCTKTAAISGDVNHDGKVNMVDVVDLQNEIAGM